MFGSFLGRLLRFLPVLIVVMAVNVLADPGQKFREWRPGGFEYERRIAALNAAGQNVAGLWSYDERLVHRFAAQTLQAPPSVLILGSSRTVQMHRPGWVSSTFQNASVSGGSLIDLMALYHLYAQRPGPPPEIILFGIDPWMLGDESIPDNYPLADDYRASRTALGLPPAPHGASTSRLRRGVERFRTMLSPTYFQLALKYLALTRGRRASIRSTTDTAAIDPIRRSDGSSTYEAATREKSRGQIDEDARVYASADPIYGLGGLKRINKEAAGELAALLRDATQRGSCVVVVLMPYHPIVYHALATSPRYSVALGVADFVRKLAASVGAFSVGSYDPQVAGLTASDFYDGMHATEGISNRIASDAIRSCSGVPDVRQTANVSRNGRAGLTR